MHRPRTAPRASPAVSVVLGAQVALFALIALVLATAPARAQDEDPVVDVDKLFEPEGEAPAEDAAEDAPPAEAVEAAPVEAVEAAPVEPAPVEAAHPEALQQTVTPVTDERTIAERGGLFGLGIVVAPKLGGGLGSVFLAGAGGTFAAALEVGYDLPLALPVGRDLEVFASLGYSAPSTTETVPAGDARLPGDGSFDYAMTVHQLAGTYGVLYRVPLNSVPWWRLYASLGARTIWSNTVISGAAGEQPFGTWQETAFDLGVAGAVGSDFYVGPGAILVELQAAATWPDRFVQRATSTTALELAVGYRFFL